MSKVFEGRKYENAIVIDNGSDMIKAGFAGNNTPDVVFPTVIGYPRLNQLDNNNGNRNECYVGEEALLNYKNLSLNHPIYKGKITNWDNMENIWHHIFYNELNINPEEHPVLLTEPPLNPKVNREKMTQIMFETFNVPAMYVANQAVLSLIASGCTTGIVLDSGHDSTWFTPIKECSVIEDRIRRLDIGGYHITDYLNKILEEKGHCFLTRVELEVIPDIKEKLGYVAYDFEEEMMKFYEDNEEQNLSNNYIMPDSQIITLDNEQFRCTELLFQPNFRGISRGGIHEILSNIILRCSEYDIDLRKDLYYNIVVSGGNTLFPGFIERLEKDLIRCNPFNTNIQIHDPPPSRKFSIWNGGSILCNSLQHWISKEEYDEIGPSVIEKCDPSCQYFDLNL